jgi:hypothetical protein
MVPAAGAPRCFRLCASRATQHGAFLGAGAARTDQVGAGAAQTRAVAGPTAARVTTRDGDERRRAARYDRRRCGGGGWRRRDRWCRGRARRRNRRHRHGRLGHARRRRAGPVAGAQAGAGSTLAPGLQGRRSCARRRGGRRRAAGAGQGGRFLCLQVVQRLAAGRRIGDRNRRLRERRSAAHAGDSGGKLTKHRGWSARAHESSPGEPSNPGHSATTCQRRPAGSMR